MLESITESLRRSAADTLAMVAGRVRGLALESPGLPTRLPWHAPQLTNYERAVLMKAATPKDDKVWRGGPLSGIRSAHRTNSPAELRGALRGSYNFLEGDVRLDRAGRPVMAHDRAQLNGMTLDDWLAVTRTSGRGLKLDIKDPDAIGPTLSALRASKIAGRRLILNVTVGSGRDESRVSVGQLRLIRTTYPNAVINLSQQSYPYTPRKLEQLEEIAGYVGGRVMFPIRADKADEKLVKSLRRYGSVAIWNTPVTYNPSRKQIGKDVRRFRKWGADGAIDLRRA